jgi:plasmid stabilization system protein ParE
MRLIYSREAVADLVRLRAFIAEKDPSAAARVAEELIARIDNLCLFPHMGRGIGPEPQSDVLREIVFGNYIVRYSVHVEALAILRIWHHYENREFVR